MSQTDEPRDALGCAIALVASLALWAVVVSAVIWLW